MHKSNEDCFYFLTASCAKGSSCTYRHSPVALTCNVVCPSWVRGNCLDPACPLRHTAIQRPMSSNGILCFYENTPMGCLKPECTFIHSRPRINLRNTPTIRPSSTNLIMNDATKPIVNNTLPTGIAQISGSTINSPQPLINEPQLVIPILSIESSSNSDTLPIIKTETITRRIAAPSDTEPTNEKKDLSNNNLTLAKSTTRSIITDSVKTNQKEPTTTIQSRLVVNRNVVIGEPTSIPSRTIVQTTPSLSSSNRVVVSSDRINSPSKIRKNVVDLVEQENETKKFKQDSQSIVDISFPCSTPSIPNRLLLISSKETTSTNDTKPIRLYRDRLPATNTSSGNSPSSVSTPSNEEKTSAGTELSQADDRRTMRIERFQKKPISPSRSVTCSASITTTRNVVTSSPNERKRTAPETTVKDTPPSKRVSTPSSRHQSSSHQTISSRDVSTNSSASVRNKNSKKQADEFVTTTAQRKTSSSTTPIPPQLVLSSSARPRFTPQRISPPPLQPPTTSRAPRPRQPPLVVIKRPLVPVTASSQTTPKPIEQISSNTPKNNTSLPSKSTVDHQIPNTTNEEDENQLLILDESADIVDTFALIDEALLEADHLLELM